MNDYQSTYYEKNKDEIAEAKRLRYLTDPEYAEKIKKRAAKRYQDRLKSPDKSVGYTVKKVDGVTLFTIKYAAKMISHSSGFIRDWEKRDLIPKTIYTDKRGWRLYTSNQIKLLSTVFHYYDNGIYNKEDVSKELHEHWDKEE